MPLEDAPAGFVPSSPALRVPSTSDPAGPDTPKRRQFEQNSAEQDKFTVEDADGIDQEEIERLLRDAEYGPSIDIVASMGDILETPARPSRNKIAESSKLESPLSPPQTVEKVLPDNKRVAFAETLKEFIPDLLRAEPDLQAFSGDDDSRSLQGAVQTAAEDIKEIIHNENLLPANSIRRVDVPKLSPMATTPPWQGASPGSQRKFLSDMLGNLLIDGSYEDDRKASFHLSWVPFTSKHEGMDLHETIEDIGFVRDVLNPPSDIIKSSQMLWKPEGLRILNCCEDGDEGELEGEDLQQIQKITMHVPQKRPLMDLVTNALNNKRNLDASVHPVGQNFSAAGSLSTFMNTRGIHFKKPKLTSCNHFPGAAQLTSNIQRLLEEDMRGELDQVPMTPNNAAVVMPPLWNEHTFDLQQHRAIVLNSALLQTERDLIRHLTYRYGSMLTIIYRDLDTLAQNLGPVPQSSSEPDMILSPSTALMFTSLHATTQRSLPGQGASRSPVHDRITALAEMYDGVFVLVTHFPGNSDLDRSTCAAISGLTFFAATLSSMAIVNILVVPSQAHAPQKYALLDWTAAVVAKHSFQLLAAMDPASFIQEETLWELFLCRAGLNPFAAQAVLGLMKKPDESAVSTQDEVEMDLEDLVARNHCRTWGLRAFVQMSYEQKIAIFSDLIGSKAVERVSGALDMDWVQGVDRITEVGVF